MREQILRDRETHNTFYNMHRRCDDPTDKHYGGRGIKVCDRWSCRDATGRKNLKEGYKNFVSDKGPRPHRGLTLERRDLGGDYTPDNTAWMDDPTQRRNKSTSRKFIVCDEEMNQCDLAVLLGITDTALRRQVERLMKHGYTEQGINENLSSKLHTVRQTTTNHQPLLGAAA